MRKFQTVQIAAVAMMLFGIVSAAEIYKINGLTDFRKNSALSFNAAENVFSIKGNGVTLIPPKIIKIDPAKKYKLTGDFRMKAGTPPARVYFGYVPYTEKNWAISPGNFSSFEKTFTTLAKAVKPGDKEVFVKDATAWDKKNPYTYVAFNTKQDFSDLPNFEIIPIGKGGIVNENGVWKITLRQSSRKAYPAGTNIRQHRAGGTYIYNAGYTLLKDTWEKRTGIIQGQTKNIIKNDQFWPGTSYVRLLFLVLNGKQDSVVEFKNIKVEEIK